MLSYLGHQISQYPNAVKSLLGGISNFLLSPPNTNLAQRMEGSIAYYPTSNGKSGSDIEFQSATNLRSNGGIDHAKGINGTTQILSQGDFPNIPGAGGAGSHSSFWKLKSFYDGVDAATNAGAGILKAQDLIRQRTAVDSFCIFGSDCAFGGKPHPRTDYYRVNVFGVRLDTVVNK
jgi:hypothetical protein